MVNLTIWVEKWAKSGAIVNLGHFGGKMCQKWRYSESWILRSKNVSKVAM